MAQSHVGGKHRRQNGESIWLGYFKFCVIRNPFDKLISAFHHFEHMRKNGRVSKWAKGMAADYTITPEERFRYWITQGGSVDDRAMYMINNEVCVDYFIRFEILEGGVKHVCKIVQVPFESRLIPNLKSGIRPARCPLRNYYDSKTIAIRQTNTILKSKRLDILPHADCSLRRWGFEAARWGRGKANA